jgi:hypothetical protein
MGENDTCNYLFIFNVLTPVSVKLLEWYIAIV